MNSMKQKQRLIKSKLKVEHFAGDSMKVIGEMCHQLCDFDKLQNQEIMDLLISDFSLKPLPVVTRTKKRPVASFEFLKNYHSGNDLTISKVRKEDNARTRLKVIRVMSVQLAVYDGLSTSQILALIKSYLDHHIIEVDV